MSRRSHKHSVVYFLETDGYGSPIKIGYTKNLEGRLEIHSKRWPELRLLATMPGDHFTEQHVHQHFRWARIDTTIPANRELFRPEDELVDLIASVGADTDYGRRWQSLTSKFGRDFEFRPGELKAWREGMGLTQESAAQLFELTCHQYRSYEREWIGAWTSNVFLREIIDAMACAARGYPIRDRYGEWIKAKRPDLVKHLVRVGAAMTKVTKLAHPDPAQLSLMEDER